MFIFFYRFECFFYIFIIIIVKFVWDLLLLFLFCWYFSWGWRKIFIVYFGSLLVDFFFCNKLMMIGRCYWLMLKVVVVVYYIFKFGYFIINFIVYFV